MDIEPSYYDDSFFEDLARAEASAGRVLRHVLDIIKPDHAVDVGCGPGTWMRVLSELHDCEVIGVDGDYVPPSRRELPPESFIEHDLLQPLRLDRHFDLALSLEVAEHLPASRSRGFVRDLTGLAPVVIFSAAPPGQGGVNHVNEQWPTYWIDVFAEQGYEFHDLIRPRIWNDNAIAYCYRQNILVFAEAGFRGFAPEPTPSIVDVAHPDLVSQLDFLANRERGTKELLADLTRASIRSIRVRLSAVRGR
jgi:SAM-dependent methyltransferase